MSPVPFFDLGAGYRAEQPALDAAALRVLGSGAWIGGPEVEAFEGAFAAWSGQAHCVGVANGTDAITLALWAAGLCPSDAVLLPALSAYPSTVGVLRAGCVPVFVDVERGSGLLDPALAAAACTPACKAILPVHLYGQPCDMEALERLALERGLAIVEDCAQAHGAAWAGRPVGSWSAAAAWSFYPTKNLGAAGDAGAVTCAEPARAERLRRLRNYGQADRYQHVEPGINSRLDPLQAALLAARLPRLAARNERRRAIGARYDAALAGLPGLRLPARRPQARGNGHLYPVFCADTAARQALQAKLAAEGVQTLIHYPVAMPEQPATPAACRAEAPVARALAATELSLPIYPELSDGQVDQVIAAVQRACR